MPFMKIETPEREEIFVNHILDKEMLLNQDDFEKNL